MGISRRKVEPGETLKAALAGSWKRSWASAPVRPRPLLTVDHSYTRFVVTLHAFTCGLAAEPAPAPGVRRWVKRSALRTYPFPSGSAKIVERIISDCARPTRPRSGGR